MSKEYIALKSELPTKVSELTNDSDFQSGTQVTTTVNSAVSTHNSSSSAHSSLFANKLSITGGYTEGQIAKVDSTGTLVVTDAGTTSVTWSDVTSKPFATIGTGLSVTNNVLSADTQFKFQIFTTLPTPSSTYAQTIALILKATTETGNLYDEYACVNTSGTTWVWEKIGSTEFELNIVQNASGITINNTALQSATSAQKGLLTSADWTTFNNKQTTANLVSSFQTTPDNTHYPSEKLVKDNLDTKQATLTWDSAPTESSTNAVNSGVVYTAVNSRVAKDNASTVAFYLGCDSTGFYIEK